jgi:alcohol dehydrogenase (cytochrome c)
MGGELGPPIIARLQAMDDARLATTLREGLTNQGMPAFPNITGQDQKDLVGFLRTLRNSRRAAPPVRRKAQTTDGRTMDGVMLNESADALDVRTDDGRVHLLRKSGERYRPVTSEVNWASYNGDLNGNRYTTLSQITKENVGRLASAWIFTLPNVPRMETTPVVVDGMMYVTSGNEAYALDAGSGRELWHFQRPRTRGLVGNAAGGFNRGVAVAGERVFMVTDNAHLLGLNRHTGAVEWETEMADWHQNYNATSAPLIVGNLVISGSAGGEQGARGFVAAFQQSDGKEVWRFWTVPRPGEPGSETWKGPALEHPSGVAWFTGSYDPQLDILYWQTGNPGPDYNGAMREGDNLYSCSVLALDPKTGKLKWHYQFTPHDVNDWDATEPLLLVDADWEGQPRKLLVQANRNGFFYVLDRTNGKLLLGKRFVEKLNWAREIGPDGRPVLNPPEKPNAMETRVCPSQSGATNWYSSSYIPSTGLFYAQTLERCSFYSTAPVDWQAGRGYLGGVQRTAPGDAGQKVLRAIDIHTGRIAWELPQTGSAESWGGTLATATGLIFFGEDSGTFSVADGASGKVLWKFQANQLWKASPMTYQFDGKQYVAIAGGQNIFAFALPE